ncbi:MAG: metal-dependent transcriptional regulator [Firmicutes bacterium]|nr:metal-dependent transcriptional regulator [Bacillota bacterium]
MALQESGEMYLETILILSQRSSLVRAVDVGEYMGFSRPSVSRAVGVLKKGGFLTVEEDGNLRLTEAGRAVAEKIFSRHQVLTDLLIRLGVDPQVAAEDACRMEHVISDETFAAIQNHVRQADSRT